MRYNRYDRIDYAKINNAERIKDLISKRETLCGMGTRKVKLALNKMIKQGDVIAKFYRVALEAEDNNISAKRYSGEYRASYYEKKEDAISELVDLCRLHNIPYGKQGEDDDMGVIYFDLPRCEQISFHLQAHLLNSHPFYSGVWDGKKDTTLPKLEAAISAILQ